MPATIGTARRGPREVATTSVPTSAAPARRCTTSAATSATRRPGPRCPASPSRSEAHVSRASERTAPGHSGSVRSQPASSTPSLRLSPAIRSIPNATIIRSSRGTRPRPISKAGRPASAASISRPSLPSCRPQGLSTSEIASR